MTPSVTPPDPLPPPDSTPPRTGPDDPDPEESGGDDLVPASTTGRLVLTAVPFLLLAAVFLLLKLVSG